MIAATWIRRFQPKDEAALTVARFWADIITSAFGSGTYDTAAHEAAYRSKIPILNKGERLIGLSQFYMVCLLWEVLPPEIEWAYTSYVMDCPAGIYYIYDKPIADLPEEFAGIQTSRYLAALECLSGYRNIGGKLKYATRWIYENRGQDGLWDLGSGSRDKVYLPLSDAWRRPEIRKQDCTMRVQRILNLLEQS